MKVKDVVELKKNEVLGEKEEVFSADDMNKAYNEAISNALEAPIDLSKLAEQFDRDKLGGVLYMFAYPASGNWKKLDIDKKRIWWSKADAIIEAIKQNKVFK